MNPLRVVIDTNVLVSSLWGGNPGAIIEMWEKNRISVLINQQILEEYIRVLERFDLTEEDEEDILLLLFNVNKTLFIESSTKVDLVIDAEDNKFIECAIDGKAGYIISGNKHLLSLKEVYGIEIVTPVTFVSKLLRNS